MVSHNGVSSNPTHPAARLQMDDCIFDIGDADDDQLTDR